VRPVGVLARAVPSAGRVVLPEASSAALHLLLFALPLGSDQNVTVTSDAPGVANVAGPVVVPSGSRSATFGIQAGHAGTAVLRFRVGDVVRDLHVMVGAPPSGDSPAVLAGAIGAIARPAPSAGPILLPAGGMYPIRLTLLSTPAASDTAVAVTSEDEAVASAGGPVIIAAGSRAALLDVESGVEGKTTLRLRAANHVQDVVIVVGGPAEGDLPAVGVPIVGVEAD
jgi:hypothetical protein